MKLNLDRKWFEERIDAEDNCDVGAGATPIERDIEHDQRVVQLSEDMPDGKETLGAFVATLRKERGLSIEELASAIGMTQEILQRIEADPNYVPNPTCVDQLAKYYAIPASTLLKLTNGTPVHGNRP